MHKKSIFALLFGLTVLGLMSQQFAPSPPTEYEPILMTRGEMVSAIALQDARVIEAPGKIWVYNNYIFLIEQYKGIHIIDNTIPAESKTIAFIHVDGCTELAIKDDIIYTNNAVDMIGIKVDATLKSIEVVSRKEYILPVMSSPSPWGDWYFIDQLPDNLIIVRWVPYKNG
jgi:hypothetical protein